jgi:hypothetical protein
MASDHEAVAGREPDRDRDRERQLFEILADYFEAVEAGQAPDRAEWLARYPEWAEEIAQRDHMSLAQVLAREAVAAPQRSRSLGRNDKLRLIKAALRRLRFPQLAATEERLATLVRELDLPRNIRVTFSEFLEGDEIRIEIVADSAASLKAAADRLRAAAGAPACTAIFQILEEAP